MHAKIRITTTALAASAAVLAFAAPAATARAVPPLTRIYIPNGEGHDVSGPATLAPCFASGKAKEFKYPEQITTALGTITISPYWYYCKSGANSAAATLNGKAMQVATVVNEFPGAWIHLSGGSYAARCLVYANYPQPGDQAYLVLEKGKWKKSPTPGCQPQ